MKKQFALTRKPLAQAITAAALTIGGEIAFADPCGVNAGTIMASCVAPASLIGGANLLITSTGSIVGSGSGVIVSNNTANTIVNDGLIDVSGYGTGIEITNGATLSGNIENSGIIDAYYGVGVYQSLANGDILNSGTINAVSSGIYIAKNATLSGNISNSGVINSIYFGVGAWDHSSIIGDIINEGDIKLTCLFCFSITGIYVAKNSTLVGNISNSGVITGARYGIAIANHSLVTGDINNDGTINAKSTGILISTASTLTGDVVNSGTINAINFGMGIFGGSAVTGDMVNDGVINLSGSGVSVTGIYVSNTSTLVGNIANNGAINAGSGGFGIGVWQNSTIIGDIENVGTINARWEGIYVRNTSTLDGNILNSGIIDADGLAIVVASSSVVSGSIANNGTINAQSTGIFMSTVSTLDGNISNTGIIDANVMGINISASSTVNGGIINEGIIRGNAAAINANNTSITLTNSGVLDGGIILGANSVFNINGGSLINGDVTSTGANSSVHVIGDTNVSGYDAIDFIGFDNFIINSGAKLSFADGETLKPGVALQNNGLTEVLNNSVGVIDHNYTHNNTGILEIDLTSINQHGQLAVNGSATFLTGAGIYIDTQAGLSLSVGESFTALTSLALTSSTFDVADDNFAFDFIASASGNNIVVTITQGSSSLPYNRVTKGVAGAVETLLRNGGANLELESSLNTITQLPEDEITGALEELVPSLAGAGLNILPTVAGVISDVVSDNSEAEGSSSGDNTTPSDKFVWMRPFAMNINQGTSGGVPGFDASITGLAVGANDKISADTRLGWSLAYARTNMDGNDGFDGQSLDIDTYQISLYERKELKSDAFTTGQIAFGWSDNDSKREINGFDDSDACYDSWYTLLNVAIGKEYKARENVTLAPEFSINYVYMDQESYKEDGILGLNVDGESADSLIFAVGSKLNFRVEEAKSITAHLEIGYDALSDGVDLSSRFVGGGPSFKTNGADPGDAVVTGGFGLNLMEGRSMNISINYDATWRDEYSDQGVSATVRYEW